MSRRTPPSPKPAPKTPQRAKKRGDVPRPPTQDALEARIWALREEGQSYRQISREVKCGPTTVWEALHKNPDRLQALVASEREERSRLWMKFENQSLKQSISMQEAAFAEFFDASGKRLKKNATAFRRDGARWAAVMRQSANDAGGKINLLTGGPTERIAGIGNPDPDAGIVTEESIIDRAIRIGAVEALPPVLRAKAEAKIGKAT